MECIFAHEYYSKEGAALVDCRAMESALYGRWHKQIYFPCCSRVAWWLGGRAGGWEEEEEEDKTKVSVPLPLKVFPEFMDHSK